MTNIKSTIKEIRIQKGVSQKSLAERLNIARTTYSKIESGNTIIDIERLINICKALDVPLDEFFRKVGYPEFKTTSDELSFMLLIAETRLEQVLCKRYEYSELTNEQIDFLTEKGIKTQEDYQTPFGGRLFEYGPSKVFRFMLEECGMQTLFKRNLITDSYWLERWQNHNEYMIKNTIQKDGVITFGPNYNSELEVDTIEYLLVFQYILYFADSTSKFVQFAARDFLCGDDEWDALEYLKETTGAIRGEICCFGYDGYSPDIEIIPNANVPDELDEN